MHELDEPRAGMPAMIVLPLLPGQSEAWRRFLQELQGSRRAEFDAACRMWGIRSLALWLALSRTADLVVVQVALAGDLPEAEEQFAPSKQPFDRWITERARELHGLDLRHAFTRYRAERLGVWPERAPLAAVRLLWERKLRL